MDTPKKDGSTLRQNLAKAEEATGQALIEHPELPIGGAMLWEWFWELDCARAYTGSGPAPITYTDIAAWAQLTKAEPEEWEVRALKMMDSARMDETAKVTK